MIKGHHKKNYLSKDGSVSMHHKNLQKLYLKSPTDNVPKL